MSARSLDLPQNLQRELFSLDSEIHGPALVRLAAGWLRERRRRGALAREIPQRAIFEKIPSVTGRLNPGDRHALAPTTSKKYRALDRVLRCTHTCRSHAGCGAL